ncbi:MAG: HAMP domain-containing histidine kinase [Chloroflexi bacterium]|nr:HAMP domain-containing histidine kinase [Chloroflexota bacterium]
MSDASGARAVPYLASLALRLMLVMGGLIIGTGLVLSALAIYLLGAEQERATQARLSTARQLADTIIEEHVTSVARVARGVALDVAVQDAARLRDPQAATTAMARYLAMAPDTSITLIGADQRVLAGGMPDSTRIRDMLAAADGGAIFAGAATSDRCDVLALAAMPVVARGDIAGRVIATTPLNPDFVDRLRNATGLSAWTYCRSESGVVTVGARSIQLSAALRAVVLGGAQVALGASTADGVDGYGYYVPLIDVQQQSMGFYGVSQPVADIAAARDSAVRWFSAAALALASLVLLEAYVLARVITRPLQVLTWATQAITSGDLSQPVAVAGRDEIGVLARSFETMRLQLARMYADLALERNRYRDFLAMVPHEFKTPLAAMGASLELLEASEGALPPGERGLLASVRRSVIRLQQLIENLLDSASLQAGQFQVQAVPSDLRAIVGEAQASVQPLFDQRRQPLRLALADDLPAVMADPRRVTQVLVNLLSNANKYAPTGEPVDVSASVAGEYVRVAVADRGPGIAPEQRAQLFQRFARLGAGGPDQPPGIGLGLAMVSEIIRLHGGQVGITETDGSGTAFWFTLPVARMDGEGA